MIDPVTGRPIEHKLVSATVIATTALEADGWDTGLMVLGTEKAQAPGLFSPDRWFSNPPPATAASAH